MSNKNINTGNSSLDRLLENFFESVEENKLGDIQQAVNNASLSPEDLDAAVPFEVILLTQLISEPDRFENLLKQCPEESHPILRKAHDFIQNNFLELKKHPAFDKVLELHEVSKDDPEHVIQKISHKLTWVGDPPNIIPHVRLSFFDGDDKLLLDTTLDTDDLLSVISKLTKILENQLDSVVKLSDVEISNEPLIDLPYKMQIAQSTSEIQECWKKVRCHLPKLGVDINEITNQDLKDE